MLPTDGAGHSEQAPTYPGGDSALEVVQRLHALALRYWAEGRLEDARRVALEAAGLLDDGGAGGLSDEVASTLRSLAP